MRGPAEEWDRDESESSGESTVKKPSSEKYSVEKRSTKKDSGIFSRFLGSEERCEECGSELVYKEGASSYYCPECQKYKWG